MAASKAMAMNPVALNVHFSNLSIRSLFLLFMTGD